MNTKSIFLFAVILVSTANTPVAKAAEGLSCKDFRNPAALAISVVLITEYLYRVTEPKKDFKSRASLGTLIVESKNIIEHAITLKPKEAIKSLKNILKQAWFFYRDEIVGQNEIPALLKTTDNGFIEHLTPAEAYGLWNKMHVYLKPLKQVEEMLVFIAFLGILSSSNKENGLLNKLIHLYKTGDFGTFDDSVQKVDNVEIPNQ